MSRWSAKARYEAHHAAGARYGFSFGEEARAAQFAAWLGQGKRLLDAGCRDGTLMRHYADAHRTVGCDLDGCALLKCRSLTGVPVANADLMQALPFCDGVFDGVVLGEVLEHLADPAFVLAEVRRVLSPGGVFVGSVPNAYRLRNRIAFALGRRFDPDRTHLHWFSPRDIRELLEAAGFTAVEIVFLESRYLSLGPAMFGNTMLWRAERRD